MTPMKKSSEMVSFRVPGGEIDEAEKLCSANGMDLTSYIVAALVHFVHAKVQQGEIDPPDFMRQRPQAHEPRLRRLP